MTIDISAFLRAAAVALVAFAVTAPLSHAQEGREAARCGIAPHDAAGRTR